jgi:hypothetical protein
MFIAAMVERTYQCPLSRLFTMRREVSARVVEGGRIGDFKWQQLRCEVVLLLRDSKRQSTT